MTQEIPDERLRLIFTCCHPALASEAQVALTLRTLGGLSTRDVARAFLVPEATLAPGGYALVVRDDYDRTIDYDPPPPDDALLLRVPDLGKNGLSNQGERLDLYAPSGERVSQFAAEPKPRPGRSIIRVTPSAPDGASSSFVRAEGLPTPCGANEGGGG